MHARRLGSFCRGGRYGRASRGEVAANLAVRAVAKAERGSISDLRNAVVDANRLVHETAIAQPDYMGWDDTHSVSCGPTWRGAPVRCLQCRRFSGLPLPRQPT